MNDNWPLFPSSPDPTIDSKASSLPVEGPNVYRGGRPIGATNYGGISLIAREMKGKGIRWTDELIECYQIYKKQWTSYVNNRTDKTPDPKLLDFWVALMPYVCLRMSERETRRMRAKKQYKPKISQTAIDRLARLEGRDDNRED